MENNATVIAKEKITDNLIIYRVKPDVDIPDFTPGQYVALGMMPDAQRPADFPPEATPQKEGRIIRRTYSIASTPMDKDAFEFYLAIVPDGSLSARICCLEEGDRIYCAPKVTGKFTLDPIPDQANLVMIATGTGVAPFLSMLRTKSTWDKLEKITLIYGIRYTDDIAYLDELDQYQKDFPQFNYLLTVSRADSAWTGDTGYVQNYITSDKVNLNPETDHIMLCGNPAMIEDLQKILAEKGFTEHTRKQAGNLHLEKYW